MIFGKRKREKIRRIITDNLKLCRLNGDLLAIEAAMRDNAPTAANEDGGPVKRFISGLFNDLNNAAKSLNVRELSIDKENAKGAIAEFRGAHSESDLSLSEDLDAFRKYIDKHLFKNDKDGQGRLAFALVFAIDDRNSRYRFPEESLEVVSEILFDDNKKLGQLYGAYKKNFESIEKPFVGGFEKGLGLGTTLGGLLVSSLLPFSVTGVVALIGDFINKRHAQEAFKAMSPCETGSTLAFRLTMIEMSTDLTEKQRKAMIDEFLTDLGNIRSDAEYKWYVENDNIPECKEKTEACDLALIRLGKILGI